MYNLDEFMLTCEDDEGCKLIHKPCKAALYVHTEELAEILELPHYHKCADPPREDFWKVGWDGKWHNRFLENSSDYLKRDKK